MTLFGLDGRFEGAEPDQHIRGENLEDGKAAHLGPLFRVALGVAYDGSAFHGFAVQANVRTVAGELLRALSELSERDLLLTCAGRTDSGVHATAQVVHVDLEARVLARYLREQPISFGVEIPGLARALSALVGGEITIWRAVVLDEGFDARRAAQSRRYRYRISMGTKNPLERTSCWELEEHLDLAAMRVATDAFLGEHDFGAFCRRPRDRKEASMTRRVLDASWSVVSPHQINFEIEANAFCHQMVRSIVGTLVATGRHRLDASEVIARLKSASRDGGPAPAPAAGLCLIAVDYPPHYLGRWSLPC